MPTGFTVEVVAVKMIVPLVAVTVIPPVGPEPWTLTVPVIEPAPLVMVRICPPTVPPAATETRLVWVAYPARRAVIRYVPGVDTPLTDHAPTGPVVGVRVTRLIVPSVMVTSTPPKLAPVESRIEPEMAPVPGCSEAASWTGWPSAVVVMT